MTPVSFLCAAVLAVASLERVAARRVVQDQAVLDLLSDDRADDKNCCLDASQGRETCGCDDWPESHWKGLCSTLKARQVVFASDSKVCSEHAGPFNGPAAECYLWENKCIRCSADHVMAKCGLKPKGRPCSSLEQKDKDIICGLLGKQLYEFDGPVVSPAFASMHLKGEQPAYLCSPQEIADMCGGYEPPCPEAAKAERVMEPLCQHLRKHTKTEKGHDVMTLERAPAWLKKTNNLVCDARGIATLCGITPPWESPCPKLEQSTDLVHWYCEAIASGRIVNGVALDYEYASKLLDEEKMTICSASSLEVVCRRHAFLARRGGKAH